ncbi:MAG: hypothetical protein GY743_17815 [Planctomycetaceae bacterium]|nr:hypothetical protein [Planctomycetaceae bacterium]
MTASRNPLANLSKTAKKYELPADERVARMATLAKLLRFQVIRNRPPGNGFN